MHKKYGNAETIQLRCLMSGADGLWASVAEEGAAMGHACSTITLTNLIRMGNKIVQEKYNCSYLRTAAINVTKIAAGMLPRSFGDNPEFSLDKGAKMKQVIAENSKEEEYTSKMEVVVLYDHSCERLTPEMAEVISTDEPNCKTP